MSEDDGLVLATLCDMVLGESARDRSNSALIRRVRLLLMAVKHARLLISEIVHDECNAIDESEKWLREYGGLQSDDNT